MSKTLFSILLSLVLGSAVFAEDVGDDPENNSVKTASEDSEKEAEKNEKTQLII